MPKKKKLQLKPVARGFATTSIPKKQAPPVTQEEIEEPRSAEGSDVEPLQAPGSASGSTKPDSELSRFIDDWQSKTDREIGRNVKFMANESRQATRFPPVSFADAWKERVVSLAQSVPFSQLDRNNLSWAAESAESRERLLARLGTLYGSLRTMGFSEERTVECLNTGCRIDLEVALSWFVLNCSESELSSVEECLLETAPRKTVSQHSDLYFSKFGVELSRSQNLHMESSTTDAIPYTNTPDVPRENHRRLNDIVPLPGKSNIGQKGHSEGQSSCPEKTGDVFDTVDDDAGGLLEMLQEIPMNDVTAAGVTVTVRNMSNPKQWTSKTTSKTLLHDLVAKLDRFAVISFASLSSSRTKRASVSIRWDGGLSHEWIMSSIACHDNLQAEQYVSTVALHDLTYPPSEGFQGTISLTPQHSASFRHLSPAFRQLWDELEEHRKSEEEEANYAIWTKLAQILDQRVLLKPSKSLIESNSNANKAKGRKLKSLHHDKISQQPRDQFMARLASLEYQTMLMTRKQLPIYQYRDDILDAVEHSQVLVLSGETGCGKSTQLPAYLLEHELLNGRTAQRVSRELGEPPGAVGGPSSLVGYSIRLESHVSQNTKLVYATNGIALRMLEGSGPGGQRSAFDDITHIVVDEVHERTIEADVLLLVLKDALKVQPNLRVILMSASLNAERLAKFMSDDCPVIHVPGRVFPVEVYHLEDAVEYTGWNIDGHSEYAARAHKSKSDIPLEWNETADTIDDDDLGANQEEDQSMLQRTYSQPTINTINFLDDRLVPYDLILAILHKICFDDSSNLHFSRAILVFMPGIQEIRRLHDMLSEHNQFGNPHEFVLFNLHSTISSEAQNAVFDLPPHGVRKIVIATNIAETGVTIPDVTCVIDSGKHREMRFDEKRQLSRLVETYIAKSSAIQRRGRAGRVQAGLCFHLFTKQRFDTRMAEYPVPEMLRLSLSDLALKLKIMKLTAGTPIADVLSRALDPPTQGNIQRAISSLVEVKALDVSENITPLGRILSKLPTDVHLGKFLVLAGFFRCLDPALTIAATLNAKSPFVTPFGHEQAADRAKLSFRTADSDFLTIHNAFASWRTACKNGIQRKFCRRNYLSHHHLQQIEDIRRQFLGYLIDSGLIQVEASTLRDLSRSTYGQRQKFVMIPEHLNTFSENSRVVHAALVAGLYPRLLIIDEQSLRTLANNQLTAFHPSSVNFGRRADDFGVNYIVYFTIMQSKRLYAWETGPVDNNAVLLLCGDAECKPFSRVISIDRKLRFSGPPKTLLTLKILRNHLSDVLNCLFRAQALSQDQNDWFQLALEMLSNSQGGKETLDVQLRG